MTKFRVRLNGTFDADSFEQALSLLADHLTKLSTEQVPPDLFDPGLEFHIAPEARRSSWREAWGKFDERKCRG